MKLSVKEQRAFDRMLREWDLCVMCAVLERALGPITGSKEA